MFDCSVCGREIEYNELYYSLNLHLEALLEDETIQVHRADCLKMLCLSCSSEFELYKVAIPSKGASVPGKAE